MKIISPREIPTHEPQGQEALTLPCKVMLG
ncbi:rCG37981 [Rattus norvegicus]|uniref:RCG37981 n=1 Tax=Rattus norvegicus TaxID=10116 RepID=A6K5Q7_RAT|nr:rCG37981 [Rattus norvegicus]